MLPAALLHLPYLVFFQLNIVPFYVATRGPPVQHAYHLGPARVGLCSSDPVLCEYVTLAVLDGKMAWHGSLGKGDLSHLSCEYLLSCL